MARDRSEKLSVARRMPKLRHSIPGEEFDIKKSEAANWLAAQPEILQYLFDRIKGIDIVYDHSSGTWQGIDYDD